MAAAMALRMATRSKPAAGAFGAALPATAALDIGADDRAARAAAGERGQIDAALLRQAPRGR